MATLREAFDDVVSEGTDAIVDTGYSKLPPMSGEEIAKELGITRQAVSQTLKRAMGKAFEEMKKMNKDMDAFEVAAMMAMGWDAANTVAEMKKFFTLFPPKIRSEIEQAASKRTRVGKK
jgi:predicted transcriptional regulator